MAHIEVILAEAEKRFGDQLVETRLSGGELTLVIHRESLLDVCAALKDEPVFGFDQLIDLCGVDYGAYGLQGEPGQSGAANLAVVYHLLSVANNHRLRLRLFVDEQEPIVHSVVGIWRVADWFEREAFDLFGIVFEGHTDLRRILTDYGFIGHPFRKDFPVSGRVEMRYDPDKGRVIYQPVTIEPRTLVPKIIREEPR